MTVPGCLIAPMLSVGDLVFCDSADFDASNDYMTRGADLTGSADGKQGTFSCWLRLDGGNGSALWIFDSTTTVGGSTYRFKVNRLSTNVFSVVARNSAGTEILDLSTAATYTSGATWLHLLAAWDLATPGARFIYINDAADLTVNTFTDDTIDYTVADWGIGALPNAFGKFNGCMAELWFTPTYIDISVEANRRKFINSDGKPVNLGSDGSTPTGTAALVYQHLDDGEAAANFATNRGSGGAFTITGSLATGSTSPSD